MDELLKYKYIFFCGISLLVNIAISIYACKKNKTISIKKMIQCLIIENIGIIIGAKILDIIVNQWVYIDLLNNKQYMQMLMNGYSFLGGVFGAFICIIIYSIISREELKDLLNILIPNLLLIYAIAKIGCYFTGCCSGIRINGYTLPIQIIESLVYTIIYLIVIREKDFNYNKIYKFCILFGFCRFVLEFLREKQEVSIISLSQLLSFSLFIVGIVFYILYKKHDKYEKNES